ncbi:hypothetical protein GCM10010096_23220 [Alcaligenes pakistanensis]|uniref:Uncharacterized protein n=1 Tax=Alcaligenes pakistanensis TaxID=1482717 RepID=A0A8H9IJZ4_9BURK|nr:hypothetical protein [Alcaligenes pakistanensis]GHC50599.1 hypothetical protein GCM10010096_23220 [Alcaligenes pakistanensis]
MSKVSSCGEQVLEQEREAQIKLLSDENRLLFDHLELLQRELVCVLGDDGNIYAAVSHGTGAKPAVSEDVLDYLFEALAENIRCQALVEVQTHLFFLKSQRALENQLGRILIDAAGSVSGFISAPVSLWRAWRQNRNTSAPKTLGGKSFERVVQVYASGGQAAVETLLSHVPLSLSIQASAWTAVARSQLQVDSKVVINLARRAYELEPLPFRQKWLAFRLYEAGELLEAEALISLLPEDMVFSESEEQQMLSLKNAAQQYRFDQARQMYETT